MLKSKRLRNWFDEKSYLFSPTRSLVRLVVPVVLLVVRFSGG